MPLKYVQESMAQMLETRARLNTLEAEIQLRTRRTSDCIAESLALMARLDAELAKLSTG